MREIARSLGCAHTNIYNYFPSCADLLWEAHTALQNICIEILRTRLSASSFTDGKISVIFKTFINFYINNIGWYRLIWIENFGTSRPESNIFAVASARRELDRLVTEAWEEINGQEADKVEIGKAVHIAHSYIIGEVSNFISGRGLTVDINIFEFETTARATEIFMLLMRKR